MNRNAQSMIMNMQRVYGTNFDMKSLKEYHDLYLLSGVLLLADVFEDFRRISLNHYELDPAQYLTAPGLTFDACLKMTGAKIELLTNINHLLFIEQGIRGGVSMIGNSIRKS